MQTLRFRRASLLHENNWTPEEASKLMDIMQLEIKSLEEIVKEIEESEQTKKEGE